MWHRPASFWARCGLLCDCLCMSGRHPCSRSCRVHLRQWSLFQRIIYLARQADSQLRSKNSFLLIWDGLVTACSRLITTWTAALERRARIRQQSFCRQR